MTRVITIGEALGVLRSTGRLASESSLAVGVGGAELNVAIGLRRLGVPSTWLGRLGPDGLGERVRRELRAEQVEVLAVEDPHPTGLLLKERDGLGRTVVTYHRGGSAGSRLEPADLDVVRWGDHDLLHVTGITPALSSSAADTVSRALDAAEAHGVQVSFDVNHRARLWSDRDPTELYRSIARRADVVFAGADEAGFLLDGTHRDATAVALDLARTYDVEAVVTSGAAGAVSAVAGTAWTTEAVRTTVVDTVGAGDAFVAGYLAERLIGSGTDRRLATAVAAGAAACRHPGDWENAITRSEIDVVVTDPVVR